MPVQINPYSRSLLSQRFGSSSHLCGVTLASKTVKPYMPSLVRFFAYSQIEPHNPPVLQSSVNFFEFQSCDSTAQVECLRVNLSVSFKKTSSAKLFLSITFFGTSADSLLNCLILLIIQMTLIVEGVDYRGL